MMSSKWENWDLKKTQRLNNVANGDMKQYEIDTANNHELIKLYNEVGADTTKINKWQEALDRARNQGVKVSVVGGGKLPSPYEDYQNIKKMAENALESAKSSAAILNESYANMGIKAGDATYNEYQQNLKNNFLKEIEKLSGTYGVKHMERRPRDFYDRYKKIADRLFG